MARASAVQSMRTSLMANRTIAVGQVTIRWKGGLGGKPAFVIMDFIKNLKSKITFRVESGGIRCIKERSGKRGMTPREQYKGIKSAISLKACCGSRLVIEAEGPDAQSALSTILELFKGSEKSILEDYEYLKGDEETFLPYLNTSAGPRFNSKSSSVKRARSIARSRLSDQLNAPSMPIRRIDGPDLAVPRQIEYLSGFIPFHRSAIEKPQDIDLSKVPAAFLMDQWEIGNQFVKLRNDAAEDNPWLMIQLLARVKGQIKGIPCVSGKGMMDDYRNVQFYAGHEWWMMNSDHPVRSAEMKITHWHGFDITVMEWLTQVFEKYPKLYVIIRNPESGEFACYFDYMGFKWGKEARSQQQWSDATSLGVGKGSKLGFEIKGPHAEAELKELKQVFKRDHSWHS